MSRLYTILSDEMLPDKREKTY